MMSKRVENAVKRLGGIDDDNEFDEKIKEEKKKKRKTNRKITDGKDVGKRRKTVEMKKNDFSEEERRGEGGNPSKCKEKYINEKLHRIEKIPQKEKSQKDMEDRKKEAIEIFRTFKQKGKRKKMKVFAKKEANLSESSSSDSN